MYLYPLWIRIWHFLNAALFLVLLVTGLIIHFHGAGHSGSATGLTGAIRWHNATAVMLLADYVLFIAGNALSGNGKYYRIRKRNFWSDVLLQAKYYRKGRSGGEKEPFPVTEEQKFNPLQRLSYVLTMYAGFPLLALSGIVLFFPSLEFWNIFGISGAELSDIIHISMGFLLTLFLIIHIYSFTLVPKPGSLLRSIISGYYTREEE
jgi:thiosulfate reductase cytochrome b subunit